MKHLIVFAHPRTDSFNMQLKDAYVSALSDLGHQVEIRDLYRLEFNPVATAKDLAAGHTGDYEEDVRTEQKFILWADVITFISPIWWMSFPAILKGYIDRVLVDGFAYGHGIGKNHTAGLLENKKGMLVTTSGSTLDNFNQTGKMDAVRLTQDKYTLDFCNISVIDHLHFGPVGSRLTDELAREFLESVREKAKIYFPYG